MLKSLAVKLSSSLQGMRCTNASIWYLALMNSVLFGLSTYKITTKNKQTYKQTKDQRVNESRSRAVTSACMWHCTELTAVGPVAPPCACRSARTRGPAASVPISSWPHCCTASGPSVHKYEPTVKISNAWLYAHSVVWEARGPFLLLLLDRMNRPNTGQLFIQIQHACVGAIARRSTRVSELIQGPICPGADWEARECVCVRVCVFLTWSFCICVCTFVCTPPGVSYLQLIGGPGCVCQVSDLGAVSPQTPVDATAFITNQHSPVDRCPAGVYNREQHCWWVQVGSPEVSKPEFNLCHTSLHHWGQWCTIVVNKQWKIVSGQHQYAQYIILHHKIIKYLLTAFDQSYYNEHRLNVELNDTPSTSFLDLLLSKYTLFSSNNK